MRLENIVFDARDPHRLGRFWAAALGAEPITDEPDLVEARLRLSADVFLDLCFPRVAAPSPSPARLHLDLAGAAAVRQLVDPEGNPYRVGRDGGSDTGPIAALALDSAYPERDAAFWATLTGWVPRDSTTLRHPAGVGPVLEFRREPGPKRGKNRMHLDVRRDVGDDALVETVRDGGARLLSDEHPWLVFADPSGNEFCLLAPVSAPPSTAPGSRGG